RTPLIAPLVSARQPLQKALDGGTTKVLFTRYYIGSHDRPLDQSACDIIPFGQARRNRPRRAARIAPHVEDDGLGVLELLEHIIDVGDRQSVEIGITDFAAEPPEYLSAALLRHPLPVRIGARQLYLFPLLVAPAHGEGCGTAVGSTQQTCRDHHLERLRR